MYARNDIINAFDKKNFLYKDSESKTKEEKSEEKSEKELKEYSNSTFTFIEKKSVGINNDLFTKYFNFLKPSALAKQLYETKYKKKNNMSVEEIKNRNEKPNQTLETVNEILDFNKEIQKQRGLGLKILTQNQMLDRLPITLAQVKAGNNFEKLEIS